MARKKYQLVIIGGGVGGLVAASGAAQLGAKVALVEKARLGGDCLHYGCVPTKSLVRSAHVAHLCKNAALFGMKMKNFEVDFHKVQERRLKVQHHLEEHDDPKRFEEMGVDLYFGEGTFLDANRFEVDDTILQAQHFLIATGTRPAVPPIAGIETSAYLTNETILGLIDLPKRLTILGGGPIGIEYAQLMQRMGSQVSVLEMGDRILPRDDEGLTRRLSHMLSAEGVCIHTGVEVNKVERKRSGVTVTAASAKGEVVLESDQLLVSAGRLPNLAGLGLEKIGVETSKRGIKVNDMLQTSVPHIYAVGDVTGTYAFTHMAEYQAGIALSNILYPIRRHADYSAVPWVTYTDPELASVGMGQVEAREKFGASAIEVLRFPVEEIDRSLIDGYQKGLAKIICTKRGRIIGASILAHRAGDLLPAFCLAIRKKMKVQDLAQTVLPYPTAGQIVWRTSQQWYRKKLFDGWFGKASKWWLKFKR
ncbi:MAG: pyridine nucleotide-disulfide oxidoreductase [Deltaproteobacteria bacterium CG_4_10_14_0_2_um_filter_43_8]|nr:MAG: pyridine nucleotide-disulfide oxidoreductase [Deltaproteobacteria bacterium CG11_big_fil_rev_8_21_14_0_20_42_23]PJA21125.1 MAG: pyridine nucleotide-disulfide oxidoreductase [Deltaproteobacteria bacterium CG_4_10_14_0_2_um_filter_43_8]PJC63552.1 MAG: pyridine nucleotide-disulfide oxidoreductase [Deltaproteobacteria bacterium CG_4_9_14_0_2_um_filter_42_21]